MTDYLTMSDEQLLQLYSEDCQQALETLTDRYMKTSKLIAKSLSIPSSETCDYVQEGMLGFLSAVYSYDKSRHTKFSTFAYVCIKNRMLSVLRKSAAKGNIPQELTVSYEEQAQNILSDLTPEEQLISERNITDILSAIEKLSPQEQKVFRLYLTGLSYDEIAEKLSVTAKAVDGTLQRARKKLRNSLSL
ncbi:MAG: sigma-70 family RNA polymerase sigma factor [Clostridia bacterium]|nr:sigma-70 family RNA polymerase sigma factor [Clostridia bacterium]